MHIIYDYSGRMKALQLEIEETMRNRTPAQIEEDNRKTEEGLHRLHRYIDEYSANFHEEPNEDKRRRFLYTASLLREHADLTDGILEVSIKNHIGKIVLTVESIQHTVDSIDSTRFLFGFLFLAYSGISMSSDKNSIRLQIIENLCDVVPNKIDKTEC